MKSINFDEWLCLCTPLSCFQRKEGSDSIADIFMRLFSDEDKLNTNIFDQLKTLKNCYDELNLEKADVIEAQITFIKRCISQDNKIIHIIVEGISQGIDYKSLIKSIDPLITVKRVGYINLFDDDLSELCLNGNKNAKSSDLVEIVKHKLENKLMVLEREHEATLRRNQQLNRIMGEIIENWRNEYFDVVTMKVDERSKVNNKLNKAEFKLIINTNNDEWFDLIFDHVDEDHDGLIEWNQFELQLDELLQLL